MRVTASGGNSGISVINLGTGATAVTATGLVAGTSNSGISARECRGRRLEHDDQRPGGQRWHDRHLGGQSWHRCHGAGDGDGSRRRYRELATSPPRTLRRRRTVTVNAQAVSGGTSGILAVNRGTGTTSVTATGLVQGGDTGIVAGNDITGIGLTVNTASVSGGTSGIVGQQLRHGLYRAVTLDRHRSSAARAMAPRREPRRDTPTATSEPDGVDAVAAVRGGITGVAANNSVKRAGKATSVTTRGDVAGTSGHGDQRGTGKRRR